MVVDNPLLEWVIEPVVVLFTRYVARTIATALLKLFHKLKGGNKPAKLRKRPTVPARLSKRHYR